MLAARQSINAVAQTVIERLFTEQFTAEMALAQLHTPLKQRIDRGDLYMQNGTLGAGHTRRDNLAEQRSRIRLDGVTHAFFMP
jgi:hypothetical protein